MRLSVRKQWVQLQALAVELIPLLAAALLVFLALLVLGPLTYVFTGIDFNGTVVGAAW